RIIRFHAFSHSDGVNSLIFEDITDEKAFEQDLQESKRELKSLIESTTDNVWSVSKDLRIVNFNSQFKNQIKQSLNIDLEVGMPAIGPFTEEINEFWKKRYKKALKGKQFSEEIPFLINGRINFFHVSFHPTFIDGNITGATVYSRDITNMKQRQNEIQQEKDRLKATLRCIADAVITTDTEGRITLMNSQAQKLTSAVYTEAEGKYIEEVLRTRSPARFRQLIGHAIKTSVSSEVPEREEIITKNGIQRLISYSIAPISTPDNSVTGTVISFRDITNQERMEREIQNIQRLESVGVLAGGIAHDFNNLLSAILGNISIALMDIPEDSAASQVLKDAETASQEAKNLTHQLLTFAKGGNPVRETVDIAESINSSAQFILRGTGTKYKMNAHSELWAASVDKGQFTQVIQNIVLNASQAMENTGTVEIECKNITIDRQLPGDLTSGEYIEITITDSGPGIPREHIENIFDPYFSLKPLGHGLGLAICHSIIQKHRGEILVFSEQGKGTSFVIYIPAEKDRTSSNRNGQKTEAAKGTGNILIMDDDKINQRVIARLLHSLGYNCSIVDTGEQALSEYQKNFETQSAYSCVIMDLTIAGGMGGAKAIKKLLEIDPNAKAIVCSGYSNDPIMANYTEHGFSGVLAKPFTRKELAAAVRKIIH
ncbi:MAG: ATP-binding protein, partial [Spirochaetia bacterium]